MIVNAREKQPVRLHYRRLKRVRSQNAVMLH